jgi:hypothetical protein
MTTFLLAKKRTAVVVLLLSILVPLVQALSLATDAFSTFWITVTK